ncbi:hypothetical protein BDQ12DRAFT_713938 [Crucibulum laeve]|uniref:F-box domain-containing protein n=1 Tax=Crucibulum laeve TaxID=68775 RepID=A0A5C3M6B8_9AGAR|nr:hypothetical protein BDQ12DRAFT_713938 [Crucibulum laeve]
MNQLIDALNLLGGNLALDENEHDGLESVLTGRQDVIASLESEMVLAQQTLNNLIQRRNEAHRLLLSASGPSSSTKKVIRKVIAEKEVALNGLHQEISDIQCELDRLLGATNSTLQHEDSPIDTDVASIPVEGLSDSEYRPAEVNLCQERLHHLMHQRDEAQDILEAHKAVLSPIRKIPTEVLAEVFVHCITNERFISPSLTSPPLLLTSICSTWRNIALTTPGLWASILVDVSGHCYSPPISVVKTWVERSGSSPLTFRITENGGSIPTERGTQSPLSAVLDIFIPHHSRWRNIHLIYKDYFTVQTGFMTLPEDASFPCLESVYLERGYWMEQRDVDRITTMILSAPRLRNVSWISQKPYSSLVFPWTQLVHFNLGHIIPMREGLHILSSCPHLKSLELILILPVGPPPPPNRNETTVGSVTHYNLERLVLHTAGSLGKLFDKLTLPHLKHLSLDAINGIFPTPPPQQYDMSWPQAEFISFHERSECAIELLSLTEIEIASGDLCETLRRIPSSLQELSLCNEHRRQSYINDDILHALTFHLPPDDEVRELVPLSPRLKSIKFWGCISSSDGVLARMLESRWIPLPVASPLTQLNTVMLGMSKDPEHWEDWAHIKRLNEKRMGITSIPLQ